MKRIATLAAFLYFGLVGLFVFFTSPVQAQLRANGVAVPVRTFAQGILFSSQTSKVRATLTNPTANTIVVLMQAREVPSGDKLVFRIDGSVPTTQARGTFPPFTYANFVVTADQMAPGAVAGLILIQDAGNVFDLQVMVSLESADGVLEIFNQGPRNMYLSTRVGDRLQELSFGVGERLTFRNIDSQVEANALVGTNMILVNAFVPE